MHRVAQMWWQSCVMWWGARGSGIIVFRSNHPKWHHILIQNFKILNLWVISLTFTFLSHVRLMLILDISTIYPTKYESIYSYGYTFPQIEVFFIHIYLHYCWMASTKHFILTSLLWRHSIQETLVELSSDTIIGSWGGSGIITSDFRSNHPNERDTIY